MKITAATVTTTDDDPDSMAEKVLSNKGDTGNGTKETKLGEEPPVLSVAAPPPVSYWALYSGVGAFDVVLL